VFNLDMDVFMNWLRRIDKPLDRAVGGQMASHIAAVLTGWGQIPPAVAIVAGLGLAVMVILLTTTIESVLRAALIAAAIGAEYLARISWAVARAIIKALETADMAVQVLTSAISLRALLRRLGVLRIIHLGLSPKLLPVPVY
jgi:hypothetical protein